MAEDKNKTLRDQGQIVLCGEIENAAIKTAVSDIVYFNSLLEPKFTAIQIIVNSRGGSIWAGMMLVDFIEYSRIPVYITGLGICASMGLLILSAGAKGHRVVTKNTTLLAHQYSWSSAGKYADLVADRGEQDRLHERCIDHYKRHTKLTVKQIKKILLPHEDVWLSAEDAKKYGLIDKVIS